MEQLQALLEVVHDGVAEAIERVWEEEETSRHFKGMALAAAHLSERINQAGEHALNLLENEEELEPYLVTFSWAEKAKAFILLWRNVLFEQQKACILHLDEVATKEAVDLLRVRSKENLLGAAQEWKAFLPEELARYSNEKLKRRQIAQWRLQTNPWPTLQTQINQLADQCEILLDRHGKMVEIAHTFTKLRDITNETENACLKEVEVARKLALDAIATIKEDLMPGKEVRYGRLAIRLEDLEGRVYRSDHLHDFADQTEGPYHALGEKLQVPVETDGGLILYREINFQRLVQQWAESTTMPIMYEVWELVESISNSLKMSLLNIRNRALLISAETHSEVLTESEIQDFCLPLESFVQKCEEWKAELERLIVITQSQMEKDFKLAHLYHPEREFLSIPLQTTINNLRLSQNSFLRNLDTWVKKGKAVLKRFQSSVEQEEALSISEKVVRFIQNRSGDPENSHYLNIFLTKGYIGESFWVGRERELNHLESLITNWRKGYRGSVLVSGRRFSGKSLFGELISSRYFTHQTINVTPNLPLKVKGRTLNPGFDLEKAMEFVRKHTVGESPLVLIDDLELWWSPELPLSKNVRSLRRFIDLYSEDLFFLVTVNNWQKEKLAQIFDIDKMFQAEVNLDHMASDDLKEAIWIRHNATHKVLVDEKRQELSPQQLNKLASQIIKTTNGNVGEALARWATSIYKIDEDRVRFKVQQDYALPDFINPNNALLLSTLLMGKRTNEYRLRKKFGPAFKEKYRRILQRLLGIGLVIRQLDGWLEINEVVANDLGRALKNKQFIS